MHILLTESTQIDPSVTIGNIKTVMLGVLTLVLIAVTIMGIWMARRGRPGENASIALAVVIACLPAAMVGGTAIALATGALDWAIPGMK